MNVTHPQLSDFTPPLPEPLVANLFALNIRTVPDFIFTPPAQLFEKLPVGSITFSELTHHIAHVRNVFAGRALTGDQLIGEFEARSRWASVRSRLPDLDGLVGNGFGGASGGRIIEVSGGSASGKTALALHIVLHHLESYLTDAALWLDTTGNLTPARLANLASRSHDDEATAHTELLARLYIISAFDVVAAARAIEALDAEGSTEVNPESRTHRFQFRIVVVDTATALLGPQLSGISSQGHAQMTTFMRLLRSAAQKHGLCILVLNDATAAGRPALGASFTFMSDATLWLARAQGQDRELRTAEVLRSRVSVCGFPFSLQCDCVDGMALRGYGVALHLSDKAWQGARSLVGNPG
ncbi:P-loop containing nucleoside triphosphate hydrolase protein [Russula earlei]|uniref:P-loop containing nucleoside triphosphate hydrolase protein n=1 Tax=Russula earlei TaxID=71964 RepID=A0ACC0TRS9_9AGAM|nr:P-loop containing nucleoside triphosphate hydrolase protein [Russula earlei]